MINANEHVHLLISLQEPIPGVEQLSISHVLCIMWPIWVLLWKHTMTRKRSIIITSVEYLSPLISIGLVFMATLSTKEQKKNVEPLTYTHLMNQYEGSVLYTPETNFTHLLMDEVGVRLSLNRLYHLPGEDEMGFYPISNETSMSLLKYSKHTMRPEDAIVIFENMDSDTIPDQLNYTIRMKTDFTFAEPEIDADQIKRIGIFNLMGFHEDFGIQYEAFMSVQWAIDTSFIYLRTGANVTKTQALQELPFDAEKDSITTKILPYATAAMFMPFMLAISVAFWSSRLFEEKNSGLFELQKSTGVRAETIQISHVLDYTPVSVVLVLATVLYFELKGLIPHTSGGHIAFACVLYFYTLVAFALVLLYVINVKSAQYAQTCVFIIILIFWAINIVTIPVTNRAMAVLCLFLLHIPFRNFWVTLGVAEFKRQGITLSNMNTGFGMSTTVLEHYLFMMVQIILFSVLAWYLSKVRPGNHGQPLPWKFPFNKLYWSKQPQVVIVPREAQLVDEDDQKYFEKAPAYVPVSIQAINIYKTFKQERVLLGVNLAVYRGEITVLLGHNGAGKTTLINVITGLIPPSSGRVMVEGKDVLMQSRAARKLYGLCPQHNNFFDKLSVIEHIMFFAMLKGQSYSASKAAAKGLLAKLQFLNKAYELPPDLSGGMKRRAQLACAVAGGSKILVLDEPTSGLDPETRRELWDLLLSFRGDHTLLMTTHFMEEADALGDRIVCLHQGRVRCHASAMFLKRAIGTGYRVTLTTFGTPKEADITSTITSVVPDVTIRDQRPNGVSYNLPAKDTAQFPELFTAIEDKRGELQIDTIGVGKSTLDEVFMVLCSDEQATYDDELAETFEPRLDKYHGFKLCRRQFGALLLRQWHYLNIIIYAITMIALGLLFLSVNFICNDDKPPGKKVAPKDSGKVAMSLDLYGARPERRALVHADKDTLAALRTDFRDVDFDETTDVAEEALRIDKWDIKEYKNYLVGIEITDTSAKALYSPSLRDAGPVALNTLTNALAARLLGGARMRSDPDARARIITVHSYPLRGAYVPYDQKLIQLPKSKDKAEMWAFITTFFFCCYVTGLAGLPVKERLSAARHAHVMAGAPRALHWAATLVAHLVRSVLLLSIIGASAAIVDKDETFNQKGFIFAVLLILLLGLTANVCVIYFLSTRLKQTVTAVVYLIVSYICISFSSVNQKGIVYELILGFLYGLLPPFALGVGLLKATAVAQVNAFCNLNRGKCPLLFGPDLLDEDRCCKSPTGSEPISYFAVNEGAGWALVILTCQAGAYFLLTYVIDDGICGRFRWKTDCVVEARRFRDTAVQQEFVYTEKTIKLRKIPDAVLCYKLQKTYPRCCTTPFLAVKGISFSVKEGECFGLLGVNGAGKSTTFKMLTCETAPSCGQIFANGLRAKDAYKKYMRTMSYCPQFGGVDDFMTGRQNLTLLLKLRGLQASDVTAVGAYWLKEVDLSQAADKPVSSYSGGMERRLVAAAALCQGARTTVLDEPTAGVDPFARRQMHRALMRAKKNRSIIVASHSMDEIEALCNRIAIMSSGELRALGTAASLKAEHGQGYTVVFKLSDAEDMDTDMDEVSQFKTQLQERFACELKDHFRGMLRYHVPGPLRYSEIFTRLEELKEQFPELVEDYTVTETTLEEVFLALAKEAKTGQPMPTARYVPR